MCVGLRENVKPKSKLIAGLCLSDICDMGLGDKENVKLGRRRLNVLMGLNVM